MNRRQLATVISWAGDDGLDRKRLQKVSYLLQRAGCPFRCRYTLHRYGPFSPDVSEVLDDMLEDGLIMERAEAKSYILTPSTASHLANLPGYEMSPFKNLGAELIKKDAQDLQLGSTMLYFYDITQNWDDALARACQFTGTKEDPSVALMVAMTNKRIEKGGFHDEQGGA
jgi:uncharacterized protein YwgA